MTNIQTNQATVASGTTPAPSTTPPTGTTPPPTPTNPGGSTTPPPAASLGDTATALLAQLSAWIAAVPELLTNTPAGKSVVTANKGVNASFIAAAMAAVQASADLQAVNKLDIAAAPDALQYLTAFDPIVVVLKGATADLRYTIDSKKAKVASQALQVYDLAKGLTRDPSGAPLLIYVNEMKKALGRGGSKKKGGGTPTPAPAPSPAPATAATAATATQATNPNSVSVLATVPAGATHS